MRGYPFDIDFLRSVGFYAWVGPLGSFVGCDGCPGFLRRWLLRRWLCFGFCSWTPLSADVDGFGVLAPVGRGLLSLDFEAGAFPLEDFFLLPPLPRPRPPPLWASVEL